MQKNRNVSLLIKSIPWQLYITREMNVAAENAMHEGWLAFTWKALGKPLLSRVNLYKNGVANIYVSADDLKEYKAYINRLYKTNSLGDLYSECMDICSRAEQQIQKNISYTLLRTITQSLAAPLMLPRLVELALTERLNWQKNTKIQQILAQYSALNEYRRPLVSEKVYPLWARVSPKDSLFLLPNEIDTLKPTVATKLSALRYKQSAYITIDGTTAILTKNVAAISSILQTKTDRSTKERALPKAVCKGDHASSLKLQTTKNNRRRYSGNSDDPTGYRPVPHKNIRSDYR